MAIVKTGMVPKLPPLKKRCTKEKLQEEIEKCCGVVTAVCNELDCTVGQFYKAVEDFGLQNELERARDSLASRAESALLKSLESDDEKIRLQAAEFILKMRGQRSGWLATPSAQQIDVKDGQVSIKQLFFGEE